MSEQPRIWLLVAPQPNCIHLPKEFSSALFLKGAPPVMIVSLEGQGYTGQRGVLVDSDGFMRFASEASFLFAPEFVRIIRINLAEDPFRITFSSIKHCINKEAGIRITGHLEPTPVS